MGSCDCRHEHDTPCLDLARAGMPPITFRSIRTVNHPAPKRPDSDLFDFFDLFQRHDLHMVIA